ncbi:MAG: ATP-binding protein, partial [Chloroflexi bacterium]|nr:ATP-binding protein [Chloroflexota bacterium]
DSFRLERVLANLLSNAIKYSPRGGDIVVTLTHEETPTRAFAVLSVSDQGMGIPAADLPHVFERFYRAGNVASEQISGSGIGLAGCCQIVEQHGGQIHADSVEGTGSTFTVRLPLDRTSEPALTH